MFDFRCIPRVWLSNAIADLYPHSTFSRVDICLHNRFVTLALDHQPSWPRVNDYSQYESSAKEVNMLASAKFSVVSQDVCLCTQPQESYWTIADRQSQIA